ncbi:hypothetical protein ACUY4Q_001792 [Phytobacter sp. AG2a]
MMVKFNLNACHKNLVECLFTLMSFNLNHFCLRRQGLFFIIKSFHIQAGNCHFHCAGVALNRIQRKVGRDE